MNHKDVRDYKQKRRTQIITRVLIGSILLLAAAVLAVVVITGSKKAETGVSSGQTGVSVIEPIDITEAAGNDTPVPAAAPAALPAVPESSPSPELSPLPVSEPEPAPSPEPDPEPAFLTSLDGYEPGMVIEPDLINADDLSRYFSIREIREGDPVFQRIYGRSYVDNNDIPLSDLRYLTMLHVNFNGSYQVGEMIVNASAAEQVTEIFRLLCEAKYEIFSMYLIDDFWVGNGTDSDTNSIDHNNTSCFCYRPATGSSHISRHALGLAIDLNPQQNPYVTIRSDGSLNYAHANAAEFVSGRSSEIPHVITESDYAYRLFTSRGWSWGGSWTNPKDYQHFQYP